MTSQAPKFTQRQRTALPDLKTFSAKELCHENSIHNHSNRNNDRHRLPDPVHERTGLSAPAPRQFGGDVSGSR